MPIVDVFDLRAVCLVHTILHALPKYYDFVSNYEECQAGELAC
jgi:hypothetical protein